MIVLFLYTFRIVVSVGPTLFSPSRAEGKICTVLGVFFYYQKIMFCHLNSFCIYLLVVFGYVYSFIFRPGLQKIGGYSGKSKLPRWFSIQFMLFHVIKYFIYTFFDRVAFRGEEIRSILFGESRRSYTPLFLFYCQPILFIMYMFS